jgi:hypothetical protein
MIENYKKPAFRVTREQNNNFGLMIVEGIPLRATKNGCYIFSGAVTPISRYILSGAVTPTRLSVFRMTVWMALVRAILASLSCGESAFMTG